MIDARTFIDYMSKRGFGPYIGVSCSFMKSLVNYIISNDEIDFITVNNEGEALAIAAGAYLSGKKPVVMLQNSGLGNMVNSITPLTYIFQIPVLLIVTLRGEPGSKDEPQHELMGEITQQLLDVLKIPSNIFPHLSLQIAKRIQQAEESMHMTSLPFAMIMKKCSIDSYKMDINPQYSFKRGRLLTSEKNYKIHPCINRAEAISLIDRLVPSSVAIVSSIGMISRELFCCNDSYMWVTENNWKDFADKSNMNYDELYQFTTKIWRVKDGF